MANTDEKPVKKSKKKLLIIIGMLAIAGAGGYFMLGTSGAESEPKPGKVLVLDAITLNLTDGHFLKLKLALQLTADADAELDGSKALDITVSEFSNLAVAELTGNETRDARKTKLREHIVEAYEHEVMDIYLTEFVMQ